MLVVGGVLLRGFRPWSLIRALMWRFRWANLLFVLLIAVPVGFALSNAHLSTVLVSFGLAAWLLIFAFYKPGRGGWL